MRDAEEQHGGRRLHHGQADDQLHQVAAGDDPVQADGQDPDDHDEREDLHHSLPCRTSRVWSSSSPTISTNAAATSTPTKKLISAIVPDELTAPGTVPSGRKFCRYGRPMISAVMPTAAKPPAPSAST